MSFADDGAFRVFARPYPSPVLSPRRGEGRWRRVRLTAGRSALLAASPNPLLPYPQSGLRSVPTKEGDYRVSAFAYDGAPVGRRTEGLAVDASKAYEVFLRLGERQAGAARAASAR